MTNKPGAPKGNRNAAREGGYVKTHVTLAPNARNAAKRHASQRGMTLSAYIEGLVISDLMQYPIADQYDLKEPQPKLPPWARSIGNDRLAEILVREGFTGKVDVRRKYNEGFDFKKLMNFGSKLEPVLREWLGV